MTEIRKEPSFERRIPEALSNVRESFGVIVVALAPTFYVAVVRRSYGESGCFCAKRYSSLPTTTSENVRPRFR